MTESGNRPALVCYDGRTHQDIPINQEVPRDVLTAYILTLVWWLGYDRAAD